MAYSKFRFLEWREQESKKKRPEWEYCKIRNPKITSDWRTQNAHPWKICDKMWSDNSGDWINKMWTIFLCFFPLRSLFTWFFRCQVQCSIQFILLFSQTSSSGRHIDVVHHPKWNKEKERECVRKKATKIISIHWMLGCVSVQRPTPFFIHLLYENFSIFLTVLLYFFLLTLNKLHFIPWFSFSYWIGCVYVVFFSYLYRFFVCFAPHSNKVLYDWARVD